MIKRIVFWCMGIFLFVALGVGGFLYYALTSKDGFSSDYMKDIIIRNIQSKLPRSTVLIGETDLHLDMNHFAITMRAYDVKITTPDSMSASLDTLQAGVNITSILRQNISLNAMYIKGGRIKYIQSQQHTNKPSNVKSARIGLESNPKTKTPEQAYKQRIQTALKALSQTVYTLRDVFDISAENIHLQYVFNATTIDTHVHTLEFSNTGSIQKIAYTTDFKIDAPKRDIFDVQTIQGNITTDFSKKIYTTVTHKGIDRDFISGFDITYTRDTHTIDGDFYNQITDVDTVAYVRSFVPKLQATKTLSLNGGTKGYSIDSGGVIQLEFKADKHYGDAIITDIKNGWHIIFKVKKITNALAQKYGQGFMKPTLLTWLKDNVDATYNIILDLRYDMIADKIIQFRSDIELENATVVYMKKMPSIKTPLAKVEYENKVMSIHADTGTIMVGKTPMNMSNIKVVKKKGILKTQLQVNAHAQTITNFLFNSKTGMKSPYAFMHIDQGEVKGSMTFTYNTIKKRIDTYDFRGHIPELESTYKSQIQGQDIQGNIQATNVQIHAKPKLSNVRAKSVAGDINKDAVKLQDMVIDVKQGMLSFGANINGNVSNIASLFLPNTQKMNQGIFVGKVHFKYGLEKKNIFARSIKGKLLESAFDVSYPAGKTASPYTLYTKSLQINLDNDIMQAKGHVKVNGIVEGDVDIVKTNTNIRADFTGDVDKDVLYKYISKKYMQTHKNIPVVATYNGSDLNSGKAVIKANLNSLDLGIPALEWKKQKQAKGVLVSTLYIKSNKKYEVEVLVDIKGDSPLYMKSGIVWDEHGIQYVDVPFAKFKHNDFNIAGIRKNNKMHWKIDAKTLSAKTIDAILDSNETVSKKEKQDMDLRFELDEFRGYNGVIFSPVQGHVIRYNSKITLFEARMILKDRKQKNRTYVYYTPKKYRMISEDVGLVFGAIRKINIFANGGRLAMVANADKKGVLQGRMQGADVIITNTPDAVRILKLFSIVGAFESKNINLKKIQGDFRLHDSVFETDNISGLGSIGISAKGRIDFSKEYIDMHGMIMPTYQISSIIGKIPVIGKIFTGVGGEGFLAQNYTMKGGFDDHKVEINPASIFTVGILRDIFGPVLGAENVPLEIDN